MTVYLIDTSAWIDYLRDVPTSANAEVGRLIDSDADIATTEPIVMELLAGAADPKAFTVLDALTAGLPLMRVDPLTDYHHAAALVREGRSRGVTVRKMLDCLIAAVALRNDATLVHKDADFDAIAKFTPLDALSVR